MGIICIHQELALFPELSIAENIFMGRQPNNHGIINWNMLYAETETYLKKLELDVSLNEKIKDLGAGQKQLVEITKALVRHPEILILDEPTSSLTEHETDLLLNLLNELRDQGVTCIYISHKLDEVIKITDNITVLRDGETISTMKTNESSKNDIIRHMVGREMKDMYPKVDHERRDLCFEIKNYTVEHPDIPGKNRIDDVSLKAYRGEILGISGLVGAGRTELFSSIFGTYGDKSSGEVYIDGKLVSHKNPVDAIENGYVLMSEDRKRFGLNLLMSIKENITLGSLKKVSRYGILNENKEISETNKYIDMLQIKAPSFATKAMNLSGGNQQKVVLGKSAMMAPKILVFDEPTRGIDVGAKYEIYRLMNHFVEEGVVVIMISSEMEEIMGMSDRVVVMYDGRITADLLRKDATQENVMRALMGVDEE